MKNSSNDLFEGNNLPARYSQAIVFLIKFMKADFRILFYFFPIEQVGSLSSSVTDSSEDVDEIVFEHIVPIVDSII